MDIYIKLHSGLVQIQSLWHTHFETKQGSQLQMQNQGFQAKINSRQSFSDHRSSFVRITCNFYRHLEILKKYDAIN